jgi:hypothetical protein
MANPETPEAALLRGWIESTIVADYGYDSSYIGDTTLLYACGAGRGYLAALLDGLEVTRPDWAGQIQPTSDVFFRALSAYLSETPSHLSQLLDHDGAYWEVRRVERVTAEVRYLPWVLSLIHREPADEAGATVIMLLADDRQSAVALADCPYPLAPYPDGFSIVFHGSTERRDLLLGHLQSAASTSTAVCL